MPALDAGPWRWPRCVADLSRHGRRAGSLPQIQVRRGGVWIDVREVSIGRGRLERQNIALWRRHDADDALRGSSEHDACEQMVLAQSLGDADRQALRDEKG